MGQSWQLSAAPPNFHPRKYPRYRQWRHFNSLQKLKHKRNPEVKQRRRRA